MTVDGTLTEDSFISITGGTFGWDPTEYVPSGYKAVEVSTGIYKVEALGIKVSKDDQTEEPVFMTFSEFVESVNSGNSFSGYTAELLGSINLSGVEFTPIGTTDNPFAGTFDGKQNTISYLTIDVPGGTGALFGTVESGAIIKNLVLSNVSIGGKKSFDPNNQSDSPSLCLPFLGHETESRRERIRE